MTDKLHCPWCGAKLTPQNYTSNDIPTRAWCSNHDCVYFMWAFPWGIWQALIYGKKARDTLKEIVANPHGAACHNYRRARRVLEEIGEITSISSQEE